MGLALVTVTLDDGYLQPHGTLPAGEMAQGGAQSLQPRPWTRGRELWVKGESVDATVEDTARGRHPEYHPSHQPPATGHKLAQNKGPSSFFLFAELPTTPS